MKCNKGHHCNRADVLDMDQDDQWGYRKTLLARTRNIRALEGLDTVQVVHFSHVTSSSRIPRDFMNRKFVLGRTMMTKQFPIHLLDLFLQDSV